VAVHGRFLQTHPDERRITVPRFVSYLSWLTIGVAAALLVVATAAFSPPAVTTLAFAIGIGTLLVSSGVAYYGRTHVVSVLLGMSTSGGRAVRRPIPRWRRRVGGHRDG
jgi:hypothetical protein